MLMTSSERTTRTGKSRSSRNSAQGQGQSGGHQPEPDIGNPPVGAARLAPVDGDPIGGHRRGLGLRTHGLALQLHTCTLGVVGEHLVPAGAEVVVRSEGGGVRAGQLHRVAHPPHRLRPRRGIEWAAVERGRPGLEQHRRVTEAEGGPGVGPALEGVARLLQHLEAGLLHLVGGQWILVVGNVPARTQADPDGSVDDVRVVEDGEFGVVEARQGVHRRVVLPDPGLDHEGRQP